MAKNTSSSAFRKIDIDQYNEDNFKEDEAEQSVPTGPDEGEVCAMLNHGLETVKENSILTKEIGMQPIHYGIPTNVNCGFYQIQYLDLPLTTHLDIPKETIEGRFNDALQLVLNNAPMGSSNQQVKDNALALTLKVLLAIKSAQIEEAVANLSLDDVDILMKYIYRGFEYPSEGSSGHLLLWHEKAYNIGGSGSIVRVLSDRMKV